MKSLSKEEIKKYDKEYNLHSWSVQNAVNPLVIDKAEGIYFWDADVNQEDLLVKSLQYQVMLSSLIHMYIEKRLNLRVSRKQLNII